MEATLFVIKFMFWVWFFSVFTLWLYIATLYGVITYFNVNTRFKKMLYKLNILKNDKSLWKSNK